MSAETQTDLMVAICQAAMDSRLQPKLPFWQQRIREGPFLGQRCKEELRFWLHGYKVQVQSSILWYGGRFCSSLLKVHGRQLSLGGSLQV